MESHYIQSHPCDWKLREQSEERLLQDCLLPMLFSRHPLVSSVRGEFLWMEMVVWPEQQQVFLCSQLVPLSNRSKYQQQQSQSSKAQILQSVYTQQVKTKVEMVVAITSLQQSSCILTAQEESSLSGIDFCPQEGALLFRRMIKCVEVLQVCMSHRWFSVHPIYNQLSFLQMALPETITAKA